MELLNLMSTAREGETVNRLRTHFELSQEETAAILYYVVPYLDDALTRLMKSPRGLAAILAQIASDQYQRDLGAEDIFQNSRILANGTGVLCLFLRNEATIRVISFIASEASDIDATVIRRMMPYIATIYISALARRSSEPLQEFAQRFDNNINTGKPNGAQGTYNLAELVLSKSPMQKAPPRHSTNRGSIKDILNTLSRVEMDEDTDTRYMK